MTNQESPIFFLGWSHLHNLEKLGSVPVMLSLSAFMKKRGRKFRLRVKPLNYSGPVFLDSAAFTCISRLYSRKNHYSTKRYARVAKWLVNDCSVNVVAVSAQDYMCEDFVLKATGLTVAQHQKLTIHRWERLCYELVDSGIYPMPVLQGYEPEEYVQHLHEYGERLSMNSWVGVGSVCKRNSSPNSVLAVLQAINQNRPDLRLHGFGLKKTAVAVPEIANLLHSHDSQASGLWSQPGNRKTRKYQNANCPEHALRYREEIISKPRQLVLAMSGGCIE